MRKPSDHGAGRPIRLGTSRSDMPITITKASVWRGAQAEKLCGSVGRCIVGRAGSIAVTFNQRDASHVATEAPSMVVRATIATLDANLVLLGAKIATAQQFLQDAAPILLRLSKPTNQPTKLCKRVACIYWSGSCGAHIRPTRRRDDTVESRLASADFISAVVRDRPNGGALLRCRAAQPRASHA